MLALGLDPSMTGFGFCVHDSEAHGAGRVVRKGLFSTPASDLFVTRYMGLRECVRDLLDDHPTARVVGVESPPFGEQWSEGLYGLFLYVNEAVYSRRRDVVFFDPGTVKLLAKGDPKVRKGQMFKSDMVNAAREDTDPKLRWNHNEADAYLIAKFTARFWLFREGEIPESGLTPAERHVFARTHTFSKGKRAGETVRGGLLYREDDRFIRYSKIPE